MIECSICIGSSCHLKGSYDVVELFKQYIVDHELTKQIELKASFCMDDCQNGVCVRVDGEHIQHVSALNASEVFETYLLPKVKRE